MPAVAGLSLAARTAAALVVVALAAAVIAVPRPAAAQAGFDAVEAAAARWIAEELARLQAGAGAGPGTLADIVLALAAVEAEPAAEDAAYAELETVAADALGAPGTAGPAVLAKALLAVLAHGGDGNAFAGHDLEAELRATVVADGADAGRFGDATTFVQSLGLLALARTPTGAPPAAVAWLEGRQCTNGAFAPVECEADGANVDADHTGLAVQALRAGSGSAAADAGVAWLLGAQADDGSFGANANSTALAAQALRGAGEVAAADAAGAFVASLQYPQGAPPEVRGAIRFTATDDGSLLLATTQGVLALGALTLDAIGGAAPSQPTVSGAACFPGDGVTVVVDLSAFGQGVARGCAAATPANGLAALTAAGFAFEEFAEFAGAVCRIAGLPDAADACTAFGDQFWAYFSATDGGPWAPYQVGAAESQPQPGSVEGWRFGTGEEPSIPAASETVRRLAGAGRVATAIAISRDGFAAGGASGVVLTRADEYADALAGTPLAARLGGPLLITGPDGLSAGVAEELARVLPAGGTVHLLGGEAALGAAVAEQVAALGYEVVRVAGASRIETAVAVAGELGDPGSVLVTTAFDFPDALTAGAAAAAQPAAVVLLTGADTPHPAVDQYLAAHPGAEIHAVGGPAARAYPGAEPVVGETREGTALAVATTFFTEPTRVSVARRDEFADALAGGAHAANAGAPLLITAPDTLDDEVAGYLCTTPSIGGAFVYGGAAAITDTAAASVAAALAGTGCKVGR